MTTNMFNLQKAKPAKLAKSATLTYVERKIPCPHVVQLYVSYGSTEYGPWVKIGVNDTEYVLGFAPRKTKRAETKPRTRRVMNGSDQKENLTEASGEQHAARDHLAAQIASGLCATRTQHPIYTLSEVADEIAAVSYLIADRMLIMRNHDATQLKKWLAMQKARKSPPAQQHRVPPPTVYAEDDESTEL